MVKFRGINVNIVSQFDIRKLPEFRPCEPSDPIHQEGPALHSDDNSAVSCYVPIYPGSQIWFEYSIDAPHPPNASYFFKLLHNGQVVTSWDCTAKHGYHGKATYSIDFIGIDSLTGAPLVRRHAFKFSSQHLREQDAGPFDNHIEFRVHRIEHRQRIPLIQSLNDAHITKDSHRSELGLVHSGFLDPGCPRHRYRYQLLDPVDEPYATIRFHYRSYAFLEDQKIIPSHPDPSQPKSTSPSCDWLERSISPAQKSFAGAEKHDHPDFNQRKRDPAVCVTPPPNHNSWVMDKNQRRPSSLPEEKTLPGHRQQPRDSKESLQIATTDSLEVLHNCLVCATDESLTSARNEVKDAGGTRFCINPPKKLQKKMLTLKIDGAHFELERKKWSPLSPFNGAGALRRIMSPPPPSAPAAVTEFGPTVAEEVEAEMLREKECRKPEKGQATNIGTTRAERGGKTLLGFLGKRIGKAE